MKRYCRPPRKTNDVALTSISPHRRNFFVIVIFSLSILWWVNTGTVYGPYTVQIRCFYGRICTVSYTACLQLQSDRRIHPYAYRVYTVFLPFIQCIRSSKYCIPTVYRICYIRYLLFSFDVEVDLK